MQFYLKEFLFLIDDIDVKKMKFGNDVNVENTVVR